MKLMANKAAIPSEIVSPHPDQIKAVRESVQASFDLGITAAQDWCAAALHTKRRPFQQWEHGDRTMHPAFWELLRIKVSLIEDKSHTLIQISTAQPVDNSSS